MKISFHLKIACGRRLLYPQCDKGLQLMKLMKRGKTLPLSSLTPLKKIGFEIEISGDPAIVKMLTY